MVVNFDSFHFFYTDSHFTNITYEEDTKEQIEQSLLDFKVNATKNILQMVGNVQDTETQNIVLESIKEISKGGEKFPETVKTDIAQKVSIIAKKQILGEENISKRKRRSVESDSNAVSSKTPAEVCS